ncbi:hypothetical protein LT493_43865 [Streptomyces tricolor]|nr:hypothetical protein [Streptomyces tricolor]
MNGEVRILGLTDKFNTGVPHYYEVGHVMPSGHTARWLDPVRAYLQDVVSALKIRTSALHAELMLHDGRVELVELHTRFGGGSIRASCWPRRTASAPTTLYFTALLRGELPEVPRATGTAGGGVLRRLGGRAVRAGTRSTPLRRRRPGAQSGRAGPAEGAAARGHPPRLLAYRAGRLPGERRGRLRAGGRQRGLVRDQFQRLDPATRPQDGPSHHEGTHR